MLFHMVASVLLSMVAFSTILWLVKILQQPIRIFAMAVNRAAMDNKTEATVWKSIKNWIRNRCHKWVYILFRVTCQKNKQWNVLMLEVSIICSQWRFIVNLVLSAVYIWWSSGWGVQLLGMWSGADGIPMHMSLRLRSPVSSFKVSLMVETCQWPRRELDRWMRQRSCWILPEHEG